ncbi:hypothetical protein GCM10027168_26960 [Streptomyces capparidis]
MSGADVVTHVHAAAATPVPPRPGGAARRNARTVLVLWQRELIRFGRNRLRIAMGLLAPVIFLLVLGTGLDSASEGAGLDGFRAYLFPGVMLMAVQAPAMAVGASIVWDRQAGFLRQMLVAPVRREAILLGICLGGATTGTAYGALVLVLAPVVGVPYAPELLLVLLVLGLIGFAFTTLGVLLAVSIKRPDTFQVVVGLCVMPLLFLSGAMFPVRGLPDWLHAAVLANPLTYAVDALRRALPGDAGFAGGAAGPRWAGWAPPAALEAGGIALLALLALAAATRRFSRTE